MPRRVDQITSSEATRLLGHPQMQPGHMYVIRPAQDTVSITTSKRRRHHLSPDPTAAICVREVFPIVPEPDIYA